MLSIPGELSELATIKVEDRAIFSAALEHSPAKSWLYYFPFLHFFGNSGGTRTLLYERVDGAILVYMLREQNERLRLSLFLPPFPFHPAPLRRARERMRDFNHDRASRIVWIQESEALPVAREGFGIDFRSDEYIYDRAAVAALEGSSFQRLRRSISQYANDSGTVVREYTKDDQRACMALRKKWHDHLTAKGVKIEHSYHRYSAACLEGSGNFPSDILGGQVIEAEGAVRAFSFGGPISRSHGSVFITISDHDWPGLAYLQRYSLMAGFPQLAYFNDSSDSGRPGLAQMKRAFRPEMHGLYSAHER